MNWKQTSVICTLMSLISFGISIVDFNMLWYNLYIYLGLFGLILSLILNRKTNQFSLLIFSLLPLALLIGNLLFGYWLTITY
ncbi:hypothetical protein [Macrococcus animalis]|uniref:hypothetical protein n=1 Tax=Macrococcus animalis TaxID=3395467 RepID=UPI0039BDE757